jgi:hypothetical protein
MAIFNGSNFEKVNSVPSQKIPKGEFSGKVRCLYDSFSCAQNVFAISDKINIGALLPKGARVLEAVLASPSLGTTGIMQLGIAAGASEAADPNAFINAADAGGQAVKAEMPLGSYGLGKQFSEDLQVQINFTEASDAADGLVIQAWIYYVLD